jgi:hypothetical protein
VDSEGKPKADFPSPPTNPWKSLPRFPHSRRPGYDRIEKWKSKGRIPTFPRSVWLFQIKKRKELQSRLLPSSFRLISSLENALLPFQTDASDGLGPSPLLFGNHQVALYGP